MKRFSTLLAGLLLVAGTLSAQEISPYIPVEEMPDLVQCLPAPPDTTGVDFAYDIARYMWGKEQRRDPARLAQARRDAIWSMDTTLVIFSEVLGVEVSQKGTPEIY